MRYDAFSKCHPAVNFLFFAGAIGCSVVIRHPAYLLAGICCGAIYYFLLNGRKGGKMILGLLPMFLILTAKIAPISWGIIPYTAYLMIPIALHTKEAIQWHISRSKI